MNNSCLLFRLFCLFVVFVCSHWYHYYLCNFPHSRTAISRKKTHSSAPRTFVHFIMEPLYKIYATAVGETPADISRTLRSLGVRLKQHELHMDPRPLLKLILSRFFGYPRGLVDMCVRHVRPPTVAGDLRVSLSYTGDQASATVTSMRSCRADGPLVMHVVKVILNALLLSLSVHRLLAKTMPHYPPR